MTGVEKYKTKYNNMTANIIENNLDKPYLKGFYNYMGSSRLAPTTIYDYVNYAVNFMNQNNKSVSDLDLDDYTDYISKLNNKTSSYQISVYSGLKKFAEYLVASKKATSNPMQYIKRPQFIEAEETIKKREKGYLEQKEIREYLSSAKDGVGSHKAVARQKEWKERDMLIIKILLTTGMRCSALYKLDVDKVDTVNKQLYVTDKREKVTMYDLSDDVIECFYKWFRKREELLNGKNENALFISNQRTRMDQSSISRVVKKYSDKIEGKNITPHKLRATYGTQLYNETGDIYFVQERMKHSNPKTTSIYIRGVNNTNGIKASDIMSRIVK